MAGLFAGLTQGQWSDDPDRNEQARMGALLGASRAIDTHGKTGGQLLGQALGGFVEGQLGMRKLQQDEREGDSRIDYNRALAGRMAGEHGHQVMQIGLKIHEQKMGAWMQAARAAANRDGPNAVLPLRPDPQESMWQARELFQSMSTSGAGARMGQPQPGMQPPAAGQNGAGGLFAAQQAPAPQPAPQTPPAAPGGLLGASPLGVHQGPPAQPQPLTPPGGGGATPGGMQTLEIPQQPAAPILLAGGRQPAAPIADPVAARQAMLQRGAEGAFFHGLPWDKDERETAEFARGGKLGENKTVDARTGEVITMPGARQAAALDANHAAINQAGMDSELAAIRQRLAIGNNFASEYGTQNARVATADPLNRAQTQSNMATGVSPIGRPTAVTVGQQRAAAEAGNPLATGLSAEETSRQQSNPSLMTVAPTDPRQPPRLIEQGQLRANGAAGAGVPAGMTPEQISARERVGETYKQDKATFNTVFNEQLKASESAAATVQTMQGMRNIMPADTGKWESFTLPFKQWLAATTGLNEENMKQVFMTEGFVGLGNRALVGTQGEFKGSVSNIEYLTSQLTLPNIGNTRQGNEFLLDFREAAARKQLWYYNQIARAQQEYRQAEANGQSFDIMGRLNRINALRDSPETDIFNSKPMQRWQKYIVRGKP